MQQGRRTRLSWLSIYDSSQALGSTPRAGKGHTDSVTFSVLPYLCHNEASLEILDCCPHLQDRQQMQPRESASGGCNDIVPPASLAGKSLGTEADTEVPRRMPALRLTLTQASGLVR